MSALLAAEILRINPDDSYDVIVGDRDDEGRAPLSGLKAGFGNFFNGYMWSMGVHDGWLYCGTYDWSVTLRWAIYDKAPRMVRDLLDLVGTQSIVDNEGGADLWRTADGENWMPVTRQGFDNAYNWGVRNLVTTPAGLFVGTANVFGPRVAVPGEAPAGRRMQTAPPHRDGTTPTIRAAASKSGLAGGAVRCWPAWLRCAAARMRAAPRARGFRVRGPFASRRAMASGSSACRRNCGRDHRPGR